MKNKKLILLVTISLTLLFVNGIIGSAQEKDYTTFTYDVWKDLSVMEKYIYIIAYQQAVWTMTYEIERSLGNSYLAKEIDGMIPDCTNQELLQGIDTVYTVPQLRELPVYYVIVQLERLLRLVQAYHEQNRGNM